MACTFRWASHRYAPPREAPATHTRHEAGAYPHATRPAPTQLVPALAPDTDPRFLVCARALRAVQLAVHICPSELDEMLETAAPLVYALSDIELPAASDLPMLVDMVVDEMDVEVSVAGGAMRLRGAANARGSVAGGLYDPARTKFLLQLQGLCVEMSSPLWEGQRELLAPCSAGLRYHRGPRRVRAFGEVSDVHVQLSDGQMQVAQQLVNAINAVPVPQRRANSPVMSEPYGSPATALGPLPSFGPGPVSERARSTASAA